MRYFFSAVVAVISLAFGAIALAQSNAAQLLRSPRRPTPHQVPRHLRPSILLRRQFRCPAAKGLPVKLLHRNEGTRTMRPDATVYDADSSRLP